MELILLAFVTFVTTMATPCCAVFTALVHMPQGYFVGPGLHSTCPPISSLWSYIAVHTLLRSRPSSRKPHMYTKVWFYIVSKDLVIKVKII